MIANLFILAILTFITGYGIYVTHVNDGLREELAQAQLNILEVLEQLRRADRTIADQKLLLDYAVFSNGDKKERSLTLTSGGDSELEDPLAPYQEWGIIRGSK